MHGWRVPLPSSCSMNCAIAYDFMHTNTCYSERSRASTLWRCRTWQNPVYFPVQCTSVHYMIST